MGADLYSEYDEAKRIYDAAEDILELPIKRISFDGPEEELKQTQYTQPAIFVHSLVVLELLKKYKIDFHAAAGHSLGEYTALVAAGAFSFEEGLKLVKLRGQLMQHSGEVHPGTMAAIIGLKDEQVEAICQEASAAGVVKPANFNSPGQIVISGSIEGVHKAMELAKEQKARMVTELTVSGAFHSPLMREALSGLAEALDQAPISDPQIPVYCNVTAGPVTTADEVRKNLKLQLMSPVLWHKSFSNMIADGFDSFLELGPGKVLSGLGKRIDRSANCQPIGTVEDIQKMGENA
ncbi:MAG: ACP S-malonyltransferase [Calditrichia bacterium]